MGKSQLDYDRMTDAERDEYERLKKRNNQLAKDNAHKDKINLDAYTLLSVKKTVRQLQRAAAAAQAELPDPPAPVRLSGESEARRRLRLDLARGTIFSMARPAILSGIASPLGGEARALSGRTLLS